MALTQTLDQWRSVVKLLWFKWRSAHQRDLNKESPQLKECFRFLNLTSRSFAALIQQLQPELRVPVCLFYLILRGLDTIEDDMTIDVKLKEPLLRNFHNVIEDVSWTYDGNDPQEKDRELLVRFDVVTQEFKKIKEEYRVVVRDVTKQMGNGMADYVKHAQGILTIQDYETYCHYVAGLVGEGLTRIFVAAKVVDPVVLSRPELIESMGQFLQQTNVIRDIREDCEVKRYFWPKAVWGKYVSELPDLLLADNKEKATQCQSEMILTALQHVEHCFSYLADIKDESVFKFTAVPQVMAIATLELCFQNYTMFERNVKIPRDVTCGLMMRASQGFRAVGEIFLEYVRKIRRKNRPEDLLFIDISAACDRIEKCVEILRHERLFESKTMPLSEDGEEPTPSSDMTEVRNEERWG